MRYTLLLFWLFFILGFSSRAQLPYARVDSTMRAYNQNIKSTEDLWRLTFFIRHHFQEDSLRLRAAFIWISDNISYDVGAFLNEDPRAAKLDYVLRKKKAICSGYASLLKYFCDAYNIKNEIVEGKARGLLSDVYIANVRFQTNHAWNAVKINNNWRLIDPTWASGGVIIDEEGIKKPTYVKALNEVYYFSPPERFLLNHYPKDLRFSYVEKMPGFKEFVQTPLYTTKYLTGDLEEVRPSLALIETKIGDTLAFRFKTNTSIQQVHFYTKREKASFKALAKMIEGWYIVKYPVTASGIYNLEIIVNNENVSSLIYKIKAASKY